MTKFDRAKEQTLKKWEAILRSWVDRDYPDSFECGFCYEYDPCQNCPVFVLESDVCVTTMLYKYHISDQGYDEDDDAHKVDEQIPLVLAVLIYLHGMEMESE